MATRKMDTASSETGEPKRDFATFRWADGVDLSDSGAMIYKFASAEQRENVGLLGQANSRAGSESRLLFAVPGFSLVHIWFKSGFPLPLHSHDADCLYYVIAGSLSMGKEILRAGDGFFVPTDVPYTYVAGDEGVELLEFRDTDEFDVKFPTSKRDYWAKLATRIGSHARSWAEESRPPATFPGFD